MGKSYSYWREGSFILKLKAIKILEKEKINDFRSQERVKIELTFLKTLNHINIIKLYEFHFT